MVGQERSRADVRGRRYDIIAAQHGTFAQDPNPALFHGDATRSWKQVAFGETNLQLTFHENAPTRKVNGETWVKREPDIDYYEDLDAHALLEVVPNTLTSGRTDPRTGYILRWIAGQRAGVPEFDRPYSLVAAEDSCRACGSLRRRRLHSVVWSARV